MIHAKTHTTPGFFSWLMVGLLIAMGMTTEVRAEQRFVSQGTPPQLIELYTSEGCSSCPPADRWLSKFKDDPRLWKTIIPIAFHVDYWNYLGWTDRFSKAEYTARQHGLYKAGAVRQVYTPGVVIDGREWRGFFRNRVLPDQQATDSGELVVTIKDEVVDVAYARNSETKLQAHFVLLGFDFESQVGGGENSGRLLKHEFVVLDKQQAENGGGQWKFALPHVEPNARKAVVIWITRPDQYRPVQTVGGWVM